MKNLDEVKVSVYPFATLRFFSIVLCCVIRANLLLHPLREGNRNSGAFTLGCKAAKAGCNLEAVYAEMSQHLCGNDFTGEELKRCLESAYQHVANEKEEQSAGSSKAPISDIATKRHIGLSENAETAEEDFQDGEELRRNTPFIPEEVYENIPELLAECLDVDMDGRQRDVRLLFTSFSNRRGKALQNADNNSFPLDILPHRFTHAEAVKVGESHGFGKRRTERILKRMEGLKIKWLSRGNYEKLK